MVTLILFTTLFFAVVTTPIVHKLAVRIDFVAYPRSDRAHAIPTPLMGGVAIYLGLALPISLMVLTIILFLPDYVDESLPLDELSVILASGTVLALVGLWDDWQTLQPRIKLLAEFLAISLVPFTTDVRISMPVPEAINVILTYLWLLYIMNAFNYLDNMDGAAAMTSVVAASFFAVIAVINGQFLVASMAAAMVGTSFGFLRYNLFDAHRKIFMGDVGSLFLGFLLAVLGVMLRFEAESPLITWPVPVLVLGIPIFDTAMVFISRTRRGKSFFSGGVDHTSHRLARLNLGHYGVPFALGLIGAALGCAAILVMHSDFFDSAVIQVTVVIAALYTLYKLEISATYEFRTGTPSQTSEAAVKEELRIAEVSTPSS